MSSAHLGYVGRLVAQLEAAKVELPEDLVHSCDQFRRLRAGELALRPTTPVDLIGLSDDELRGVFRDAVVTATARNTDAGRHLLQALAVAIADAIRDQADAILEQLRPDFDDAAAVMHEAASLGLRPGTAETEILKADNVVELRDAWAQVPAAARTLEQIAQLRMALSTTAGAPPAASEFPGQVRNSADAMVPRPVVAEWAARMFRIDGQGWQVDGEEAWQRWLRLSETSPVQLLPTTESSGETW